MTTNDRASELDVLALSAYHAPSHRRWLDGLVEQLSHQRFQLFTQPPRHFSWRSRGNSLSWAFDDDLRDATADRIVATSMVDLAGLRGMLPRLVRIPTLVYFHENQFAYPTRGDDVDAHLLLTNLYTALAADRVLFNSGHNRRTFAEGAQAFLDRMPDRVPDNVVDAVMHRSDVLPVPLEDSLFDAHATPTEDGPLRIVWNHRWEHDKAPERFFRALFSLRERVDFRLVVMGQQFRTHPPIFEEARRLLDDHIDHWGWVERRAEYLDWLCRSDIVVSTSLHEFQGLAIQEAVALGCLPLLPDRLAYPDFFDGEFLYPSHPDDANKEIATLTARLEALFGDPVATRQRRRPDLSHLRWSRLRLRYDRELREIGKCSG